MNQPAPEKCPDCGSETWPDEKFDIFGNPGLWHKPNCPRAPMNDRCFCLDGSKRPCPLHPPLNQDTGPREPPETIYLFQEIARLAKGAALGKPVYGLCPAGCGCVWRDNFDGTMSLGMNQRSCKVCEFKPFAELIPLYARPAHNG